MSEQQNIVKRYPILSFAILSYLLSWWPWLIPSFREAGFRVLPHGPSIAAIIITAIVSGGPAVKRLLSRLVPRWAQVKWYVIGMGMTIVITLTAVWLNVLFGAPTPTAAQWNTWPERLPFFIFAFLMFGAMEELGWRGFGQAHLQKTHSALVSALIVAIFGVIWHFPLFATGNIELPDVPLIFAGYIVYAWLFNSSGGSVLVTMLTHAMNNTVSGEWISPWFTGADSVRQSALLAVLWSVAAIVVIALAGPARLTRRPMVDTEMAPQPVAAGD
jgi:membrane protease YdiL (CAAX protease family)